MYDSPHKQHFANYLNEPQKIQLPANALHARVVKDAIFVLFSWITCQEAPREIDF